MAAQHRGRDIRSVRSYSDVAALGARLTNHNAKELGSLGGKARAKKLTEAQRKEIASKAGKASGVVRREKVKPKS